MRYDSHCHLSPEITEEIYHGKTHKKLICQEFPINLMMTNHIDERIIMSMLKDPEVMGNKNIMLNIGIHPWFSHLYTFFEKGLNESVDEFKTRHYTNVLEKYSKKLDDNTLAEIIRNLPVPIHLPTKINDFETILITSYNEYLNIGEIGLDKLARIPCSGFLYNPATKITGLSNYKIKMSHQVEVFKLHLNLAVKYKKSCSVHCVGAHGLMYNILKTTDILKLIMHSYSGSVDSAKMMISLKNLNVWFGLSDFVNLKKSSTNKLMELLTVVKDRVLVETDYGVDWMLDRHAMYTDEVSEKLEVLGIGKSNLWLNWETFLGEKQ